jgi:CubicO group peptidase (beta-lactamase class C family)
MKHLTKPCPPPYDSRGYSLGVAMHINRRTLIAGASLAALSARSSWAATKTLPTASPKAMGFDAERLKRIPTALQRRVDAGEAPGFVAAVMRNGKLVQFDTVGYRDIASKTPMTRDTIFRIMSMTKPITSVAAMMLVEENKIRLTDPVAKYIPAFAQSQVYVSGEGEGIITAPAKRRMQIRNLIMHTSGLSYGSVRGAAVEKLQALRQLRIQDSRSLPEFCDAAAQLPLLFEPGTQWNYGISTDILGRVVEVASGQPLAEFFQERIFAPLGMTETAFFVSPSQAKRLVTSYGATEKGLEIFAPDSASRILNPPAAASGGGGLVSTADDYLSFATMLLNEGELNGARILGPETVRLMRANHLSDAITEARDTGFGLGFGVDIPGAQRSFYGGAGSYHWSGARRTHFWVDPTHRIVGLSLTQVDPFNTYFEEDMRALTYQAFMG